MREKEVKLLKVCMGADDRELARYAKTKLKDKGFLIENLAAHSRDFSRELAASLNSLFQ